MDSFVLRDWQALQIRDVIIEWVAVDVVDNTPIGYRTVVRFPYLFMQTANTTRTRCFPWREVVAVCPLRRFGVAMECDTVEDDGFG